VVDIWIASSRCCLEARYHIYIAVDNNMDISVEDQLLFLLLLSSSHSIISIVLVSFIIMHTVQYSIPWKIRFFVWSRSCRNSVLLFVVKSVIIKLGVLYWIVLCCYCDCCLRPTSYYHILILNISIQIFHLLDTSHKYNKSTVPVVEWMVQ